MKIVLDGFGGDHAPLAPLEGAAAAVAAYGVEMLITGDQQILTQTAAEHHIPLDGITFHHTTDVIQICDDPASIMAEHQDSSMAVGMKLVRDGVADAFVSAGSTGALTVGATLLVKRLKGVKRVTIVTMIPTKTGCYLLGDAGANVTCRPEMLVQFGVMGSIYMEKMMGVSTPRVALLNIGEEASKGQQLQLDTYGLLQQAGLNFIGNIEARDLPQGKADVVLTDGFTGNIVLKLTEGVGQFMMGMLKNLFTSGLRGKLAALLVLPQINQMKQTLNYKEYGGAPLLGAAKPVFKAHGSSDAYAFQNAIRSARDFVAQDLNQQMLLALAQHQNTSTENS